MRIQRPIIVRDHRNLYSDSLQMTQAHQEMYECVQPLQGHISFTDYGRTKNGVEDKPYRNTLSLKSHGGKTDFESNDVDNLVWVAVIGITVLGAFLWGFHTTQWAFNAVTLTQFAWDGNTYTLQYAGDTKPLFCLIIALGLLACSLVVGWQSKRHVYIRSWFWSCVAVFFVGGMQVLMVVLHFVMLFGEDSTKNFLENFMLTNAGMLFLHLATAIITLVIIVLYAFQPMQPVTIDQLENNGMSNSQEYETFLKEKIILAETEGNFWLCVAEDLNMIVFYAFIFRACNSQISVHDDTATFFDVLCVVVIGFLQHIANILMIFHAHIKIEKDIEVSSIKKRIQQSNMEYIAPDDTKPLIASTDKIIKSIARTRALVFFMIAVVTVFLYLRIAPTCEEFPAGIPFEMLRSLALVCMISLSTLHSLSFEMQGSKTDTPWDTSPTWKLLTTGLIACILAGFLMADVAQHRNEAGTSQASHTYLIKLAS